MASTGIIRTRLEPQLKMRAEEVLRSLGLSATDAITLFYHQVVLHLGLPFAVGRPDVLAIRKAVTGTMNLSETMAALEAR